MSKGKSLRRNRLIKACFEADDDDDENLKQFRNNGFGIMLTRIDFTLLRN
jgi:hypothetical protein